MLCSTQYDLEANQAECKGLHDAFAVLQRKQAASSDMIAIGEASTSQLEFALKKLQKPKEESDFNPDKLRRQVSELEKVINDNSLSEKQLHNETSALKKQLRSTPGTPHQMGTTVPKRKNSAYPAIGALHEHRNGRPTAPYPF